MLTWQIGASASHGRRQEENRDVRAVNAVPLTVTVIEAIAMTEWQPIETAPTDGSYILTFAPDAYPQVAVSHYDYFPEENPGSWRDDQCQPTHWMPLPHAPPDTVGTLPVVCSEI